MNLVSKDGDEQRKLFYNTFFAGENDLFTFSYEWLRGANMSGVVNRSGLNTEKRV